MYPGYSILWMYPDIYPGMAEMPRFFVAIYPGMTRIIAGTPGIIWTYPGIVYSGCTRMSTRV